MDRRSDSHLLSEIIKNVNLNTSNSERNLNIIN